MRDHTSHIEVSKQRAIELLLENSNFNPGTETVCINEACGRVLAKDAIAQLDMPNCLTCNMDSVAVHWDDFKEGMPDTSKWKQGDQWEFANTGIGMPEGYDTAIVIEHVILSDDLQKISFDACPSQQYAGTSPIGSKMHKGDVLAKAKSLLTPLLVSHIASGNNTTVDVVKKPIVAFIPTGNELLKPGSNITRGKNIETNSLLADAKIREWGGTPIIYDIAPDDQEAIKDIVIAACNEADIVVLNAGSSKGSDDWNIEMLEEVGTVLYHETNHGPGHHSSGAIVNGTPVVGISGPPAGASFTMDFYLYPIIMNFLGLPIELKRIKAEISVDMNTNTNKNKDHNTDKKTKGEVRPDLAADNREFFSVRQTQLCVDESGKVIAIPSLQNHVAAPEANTMNGYFYMSNKKEKPAKGDLIEVDIRPYSM